MDSLHTPPRGWVNLGIIDATAAAADATLTVAERNFLTNKDLANVVSTTLRELYASPYQRCPINAVEVRFSLATADHDVDIDVWAGRMGPDSPHNADLARVCTLDVINGTQVAESGLEYADTINISNANWIKTVYAVVPGAEGMARLIIDLCGCDCLLFHGYGTFDGDCTVEVSGF